MLKKNLILINLGFNNNLYSTNTITRIILINRKLIISLFSKNNTHFLNLKNNLC